MTLSFTQTINGKPNYFIEKIWAGILKDNFGLRIEYGYVAGNHNYKFDRFWDGFLVDDKPLAAPKLHTIRQDTKNRWGTGCDIHFVINNRTPNRFQFAPVIKCVSVQSIKIDWNQADGKRWANVFISTGSGSYKILGGDSLSKLAFNDGFDSVEDFFAYFNKDFTGKLIHWTTLKY